MSALNWIATGKQLASKRIAQLLPKNKIVKNSIRRIDTAANKGQSAQATPVNNIPQSSFKKFGRSALMYGLLPTTLITGALLAIPSTREYVLSGIEMSWRFARSANTAAMIAYDYKRSLSGKLTEERRKIALQEAHDRNAKRLLRLFKQQGGIYVKAGQHMSSLTYVLPPQYCYVMRELHNKAASQEYEAVERAFVEEFGVKPEQMFDTFDKKPVAAASLAQVHHATKDGQEFAVKVQFPDIRKKAFADVNTIDSLVTVASWFFPEFKLRWLVREFRDNLPKELDFTLEGRNGERARANASNQSAFTTPRVFWNMSTSRILTMEYVHGVHISDIKGLDKYGFNHKKVADLFNQVLSEQIFLHGFVHCDPHPGNVLVRPSKKNPKEPQIVLLDNGLYKEYEPEFRLNYSNLWLSILQQDEEKIKEYSLRLGPTSYQLFAAILTARSWNSVASATLYNKLDTAEKDEIQSYALAHTSEITEILQTVPSALLLLLKTNDLMRVINHDLGMNSLNVFGTTLKYCLRSINEDRWRHHKSLKTWFRNTFATLFLYAKLALTGWSMWLSSFMLTDE